VSSNDSARFAPRGGASLAHQALDAQAALLPYALVAFVVSMPVFVWAGSYADNAAWMTASFALFAMACGATYAAVNWLRTPAAADLRARARVHIVTGLVWAGCVAQVAAFADGAGPMRETLLLMATAAAVICIFFTAPWLPSLLVVGAAAAAGPLIALFASPHSQNAATLAWGGVALALPWR
jgi:two-component system, sensor histidine kinase